MESVSTETPPGTENYDYEYIWLWRGPTSEWGEVIIQTVVWCLCVVTLFGNALVIMAFIRDRRLRAKIPNMYILNLSLADFIVGCVTMPIQNAYRHTGIWRFGEAACKFWLSMDYGGCCLSMWAIVLISYDRYILITKGLEYGKLQTLPKFMTLAACMWFFSLSNAVFSIVGSDLFVENTIDYSMYCDSAIFYTPGFVIYDVFVTFLIPVIMIIYFNTRLFTDIKKRSRGLPRSTASIEPSSTIGSASVNHSVQRQDEASTIGAQKQRQGTTDIRKHRRGAITLALIVGVSSLCWLPYKANTILGSIFGVETSIRSLIISLYIFYSNSAINPLLYVATNPRIREGMIALIKIPFAAVAQLTQNT